MANRLKETENCSTLPALPTIEQARQQAEHELLRQRPQLHAAPVAKWLIHIHQCFGHHNSKICDSLPVYLYTTVSQTQHEHTPSSQSYERQLGQVRDSFDPSSSRTQTDLSDAVPRLAFMDPSEELYWPILDSSDLAYKLYPIKLRPLPGAEDEPTGLIQDDWTPMPITIPRGFLTTQMVIPPAWLTTMSWRDVTQLPLSHAT